MSYGVFVYICSLNLAFDSLLNQIKRDHRMITKQAVDHSVGKNSFAYSSSTNHQDYFLSLSSLITSLS